MKSLIFVLLFAGLAFANFNEYCENLEQKYSISSNYPACANVLNRIKIFSEQDQKELKEKTLKACENDAKDCRFLASLYLNDLLNKDQFKSALKRLCLNDSTNCKIIFTFLMRDELAEFVDILKPKCAENVNFCGLYLKARLLSEPLKYCQERLANCDYIKSLIEEFTRYKKIQGLLNDEEITQNEEIIQQLKRIKNEKKFIPSVQACLKDEAPQNTCKMFLNDSFKDELIKRQIIHAKEQICNKYKGVCYQLMLEQDLSPKERFNKIKRLCENANDRACERYLYLAREVIFQKNRLDFICRIGGVMECYLKDFSALEFDKNLIKKCYEKGDYTAYEILKSAKINESINKYLK